MTNIYVDPEGKKEPDWAKQDNKAIAWIKKHKILTVIFIVIAILLIVQFAFKQPVAQEVLYTAFAGFSQELYAFGDGNPEFPDANYVVFPYSILFCEDDHSITNIFSSIFEDSGIVTIYTKDPQNPEYWLSWSSAEQINDFETITYYTIYYVYVDSTCTLSLSCWD